MDVIRISGLLISRENACRSFIVWKSQSWECNHKYLLIVCGPQTIHVTVDDIATKQNNFESGKFRTFVYKIESQYRIHCNIQFDISFSRSTLNMFCNLAQRAVEVNYKFPQWWKMNVPWYWVLREDIFCWWRILWVNSMNIFFILNRYSNTSRCSNKFSFILNRQEIKTP